jgi:hypothetical protein
MIYATRFAGTVDRSKWLSPLRKNGLQALKSLLALPIKVLLDSAQREQKLVR